MSNPIVTENQNTGTTAWKFSQYATTQIQAYANTTSLDPGSTITFYVSTQTAGTSYTIKIYRLGWYGGTGGRLITTLASNTGLAQGYFDGTTLNNCPTAISDSATHNLECGWAATDTWTVPGGAVSGIYVAIVTDGSGNQWGVSFVVRGNTTADYAVYRAYTTDNAYNIWGGYSLYTNPTVGTKVSFNRPQGWGDGGQQKLYSNDVQFVHWAESLGYNMAYRSNIDLHTNAAELLNFKCYVSLGHDEYWSLNMRNGVETAISRGVNAAFMGANNCYWQIRFENDNAGNANRTQVCYKVTTAANNLALDPQYGISNALVTSNWTDAVLNRPQATMIGMPYKDNCHTANVAWTVDANADTTFFTGTGLVKGQSYGSDIVGNEWDAIGAYSPAGINTIGTSATINGASQASVSNTTWYRAPSNALVFATGSIQWANCLDSFRLDAPNVAAVPQMQTLMQNILAAMKGPVFSMVGV